MCKVPAWSLRIPACLRPKPSEGRSLRKAEGPKLNRPNRKIGIDRWKRTENEGLSTMPSPIPSFFRESAALSAHIFYPTAIPILRSGLFNAGPPGLICLSNQGNCCGIGLCGHRRSQGFSTACLDFQNRHAARLPNDGETDKQAGPWPGSEVAQMRPPLFFTS